MLWLVPAVLSSLLGLLLVALGAYAFLQRCWLTLFGEHTVGTVVGFVADENSPPPDHTVTETDLLPSMPFLRIAFTDYFGQSHEVTSASSVSPKKFRPGDPVPLLYRSGRPDTFVVNRFWMKWSVPMAFIVLGLALSILGLLFVGTLWPAFGDWVTRIGRQAAPLLVPILAIGLPTIGALLGAYLIYRRMRRLREDYRTQGTIIATGWVRVRSVDSHYDHGRWIRVAYRDADGHEQTRTLSVATGLAAPIRREGQTVHLLVDPTAPQDILLNESGELWFLPLMFLTLGLIVALVFTWAWLSGQLTV